MKIDRTVYCIVLLYSEWRSTDIGFLKADIITILEQEKTDSQLIGQYHSLAISYMSLYVINI